jgi:hypothetical protein
MHLPSLRLWPGRHRAPAFAKAKAGKAGHRAPAFAKAMAGKAGHWALGTGNCQFAERCGAPYYL